MNNTSASSASRQGSKVLFALLAALTALVLFCGTSAFALSITDGDFSINYRKSGDTYNSVTVEKYTGNQTDVVLPATVTIDGTQVPITTVKTSVFEGNEFITSVVIPEGYTELPYDAFSKCIALKSVTIPGSLTMIGSNAFENCSALQTVTFAPDTASGLNLGNACFANCTSLNNVVLPARASLNNGNVFYGCTALTKISVDPANAACVSQNDMVFQKLEGGTVSLTVYPFGVKDAVVEIPASVNGMAVSEVGPHLFRGNAVVTEVTLPASVKTVERFAFNDCSALMTVNVLTEDSLLLNSNCFVGMPAGSVINVPNETIAAAFEPTDEWTTYYDPATTTVKVAGGSDPTPSVPADVAAALTLKAAGITESGVATFDLYLDSASCVSTLMVKLSFDPAQMTMSRAVLAGDVFKNLSTKENDDGSVSLMFNQFNNVLGYTGDAQVKIGTITMNKAADISGRLTLTVADARVSGINDVDAPAVSGTVTLNAASDSVFVANYDVNKDGTVDQVDITEAQRYYQESASGNNWAKAAKADVNGDGRVDLEDLIAIFHNLSNF